MATQERRTRRGQDEITVDKQNRHLGIVPRDESKITGITQGHCRRELFEKPLNATKASGGTIPRATTKEDRRKGVMTSVECHLSYTRTRTLSRAQNQTKANWPLHMDMAAQRKQLLQSPSAFGRTESSVESHHGKPIADAVKQETNNHRGTFPGIFSLILSMLSTSELSRGRMCKRSL